MKPPLVWLLAGASGLALAFRTLGAWVASQFSTGAWKLADAEPVLPPG